jgi:sugar phosphate isomerase/epimerase
MLCYSTGSLPDGLPFASIADILSSTPFSGVELVVTASMLKRAHEPRYWEGIRDSYLAKGLAFRNVHLGAPHLMGPAAHRPGLSSLDPDGRAAKIEAAVSCMVIAKALACPHLTVTTGLTESEGQRTAQETAFREALAELVQRKPRSLKILIEQEPEHAVNSAAQLLSIGRAFPGEVYANFDVGHSHVIGEDIGAAIRDLGPLLRNIHFEDIRGRVHEHKLFGDGDIDFASIFRALHEIGYRGDFTPDLYPFKDEYLPAIDASVSFLRHYGVLTRAL